MSDADIIVIGSGPAGVSAALPPVEAGRKVLMLDGADDRMAAPASKAARVLGDMLEGLTVEDGLSPKMRAPEARRVMGRFFQDGGVRGDNFLPVGSLGRGGLSRVWGAFVAELDATDVEGWPVRHADMAASYERVTRRIGVSGTRSDAAGGLLGGWGPLQPPLPLGAAARSLLKHYKAGGALMLGQARNALLSEPHAGRSACDLRGGCLWGCPIGAIYDARQDLARLARYANFRIGDNCRVVTLEKDNGYWHITIADGRRFSAPRILLAAGTLGSTRLVAPLLPDMEEWALLSNPVLASPLLVPAGFFARATPSHDLAQLAFLRRFQAGASGYVSGALYGTTGLPPSSFANQLPLSRNAAEAVIRFLAPALMVAVTYFPGAYSRNRLKYDPATQQLHIVGGFDPAFAPLAKKVEAELRKNWRDLGAVTLPGGKIAAPGTDAHFAGTLPMGGDGPNGTNLLGELAGLAGLHVVDGAVLPSLSSKHATLTIMANADRIGGLLSRNED